MEESPTAVARALAKAGKTPEAEAVVAALIAEEFGRPVQSLSINRAQPRITALVQKYSKAPAF